MRWTDWYGDGSLYVLEVGLACCSLELAAAAADAVPALPLDRPPQNRPPPGAAAAVLVSGTVTDRLAPAVLALVEAAERTVGGAVRVVALGACASSGGPYWDAAPVTKGVDQLVPVHLYVPGCPPPPEAVALALAGLRGAVPAPVPRPVPVPTGGLG